VLLDAFEYGYLYSAIPRQSITVGSFFQASGDALSQHSDGFTNPAGVALIHDGHFFTIHFRYACWAFISFCLIQVIGSGSIRKGFG